MTAPVADLDIDLGLARDMGTPLVVHDLAVVRARASALRAALPARATLLYSLKANPLPPVVAALQAAGCGSEVSSAGELAVALGNGEGAAQAPVVFTGPAKTEAEIAAALAADAVLSCESPVDLARVAATNDAGQARVVLRVRPPSRPAAGLSMADGHHFGFTEDEAIDACRRVPAGVDVLGFHCYLGSQLSDCGRLLAGFAEAAAVVGRVIDATGLRPAVVDLGGGFPWPYAAPGDGPDLSVLRAGIEPLLARWDERTAVWFESGRSLVAAAGRLLTTVMDVKERGGALTVVIDAGVNVLGGMSGLGRTLRPATMLRNVTSPGAELIDVDVVGPACTPLDRVAVRTSIARPRVGDVLRVDNVGAYATTASLVSFLLRTPPLEVVTDGDGVVDVWRLDNRHARVERP